MKWLRNVCVSLMLINSNVYTFVSGIFISLSTNIFTSLCFAKEDIIEKWYLYLATVVFTIASAVCMYLATKISRFQNYIIEKRIIDYVKKREIVLDATRNKTVSWIVVYLGIVLMVIFGSALLVLHFVIDK